MARTALLIALVAALVLGMAGCAEQDSIEPPRREQGESNLTSPPPGGGAPGVDAPGEQVQGTVGTPAVLGGWTILVREAEQGGGDGDDGAFRIEADISHNYDEPMKVQREDWSLVDATGAEIAPSAAGKPEEQGDRTIPPGETEDVKMSFDTGGSQGPFLLRFEPAAGAGGALNIAVP